MTSPPKRLRATDLRGIARLATQATTGAADIAEGVHQSVWGALGVRGGAGAGRTGGLTGLVYRSVRAVAQLAGQGVDVALAGVQPLLAATDAAAPDSPQREAVLAALNGVLGDRLALDGNPLATPMSLRWHGRALAPQAMPAAAEARSHVLLLIHGLCMNDLQWRTQRHGVMHDHGDVLAAALGATPLYLRYNTGRHVSDNGAELAALLEGLLADWPLTLQTLTVVAHSMGGLVARSAAQIAEQQGLRWRTTLRHIVFLGTPHHGAPLERAGHGVDVLLGATPFSRPFKKLVQLRSAGITDLRHGRVQDAGQGAPLPLPAGVASYTVAATTAAKRSTLADRLVGDGLVPLRSALGQHDDPARTLAFAKPAQWVAYRMNHMELLSRPEVSAQMLRWLAAPGAPHPPSKPKSPAEAGP